MAFLIIIRGTELRHAEQGNDFIPDRKVAFKLISEVLDNRITRQTYFDDEGFNDLEPS